MGAGILSQLFQPLATRYLSERSAAFHHFKGVGFGELLCNERFLNGSGMDVGLRFDRATGRKSET